MGGYVFQLFNRFCQESEYRIQNILENKLYECMIIVSTVYKLIRLVINHYFLIVILDSDS